MIRMIGRRLIIPRGDTGSFSLPALNNVTGNIAVFTIFDNLTRTKLFQKIVPSEGDTLSIAFSHNDTVNLKPGKYCWDIKYYTNPEFVEDELVNGDEVDSYYAGFALPICEIRETADNYLVSPDGANAKISPQDLDIISNALIALDQAVQQTQANVDHYPTIGDDGYWYAWDAETSQYVNTGVKASGSVSQLHIGTVEEGPQATATITGTAEDPVLNLVLPTATVPTKVSELDNDAGYLTQHQDISGKQDVLTFDTTPTQNSTNPVTSGGIKTYVDTLARPAVIEVSGTNPVIVAEDNTSYVCGEIYSISITPPATGIFSIVFSTGDTIPVFTSTSILWPDTFDPSNIQANMVYEINVLNGRGVVGIWAR